MDEEDRQRYETQSKELRVKLKDWELEFAKSHGGAKPTRDDIKANPKIASFSKRYHRLRDVLCGKFPHTQVDDEKQDRKRKPHAVPSHTPSSKRFRPAETPSSRQHTQAGLATPHGAAAATTTAVTPSLSRKLFSPAAPTSIGPTPQRDGRVLGLFDLLPFKDAEIDSPSRPKRAAKALHAAGAVQETPRRGRTIDTGVGIAIDLDRTPSSRSTRQQQQALQTQQTPRKSILSTPLKDTSNRVAKTPSSSRSVSKLQFQTPAFLRRIPMSKINENSEFASPEPIRLPRKPLVRGLSSIVADLRKTQEEDLDDDLDALRELENEAAPACPAKKPSAAPPNEDQPPLANPKPAAGDDSPTETILAEDSQKRNLGLLGGFDDEGMYDSEDGEEEGLDRDGKPLRVFKKKGQKRTTRKANMRPVMTRRPPSAGPSRKPEQEEDGETVPGTQVGTSLPARPGADEDADQLSGSDFAGSDYDDDEDELAREEPRAAKKATAISKKKAAPAAKQKPGGGDGDKPEGKVKKTARKVNELAHANFKRLKLRNSGAKGGQGFNSRFRRRR
ncbi:putative dna replication regulator sld2 [Diaporthe ampelina]|uniref:DNA replication regulator SLD2 n=1 Tax=Diaporthe ampelina TaxID=1214573 RepID=A0A0G2I381_9PEZI|nr:putative dna replication regulator sld2 [Diaporthe ampelina]